MISILRFPDEIIHVKVVPGAYELSGAVTGTNADIKISKGVLLKFELDAQGHPFWIKTEEGIGKDNDVSSGISGVGQGKTSGVLIWDTTEIMEGTYYYQCEYHARMFGKINVMGKTGTVLFKIQLLKLLHYLLSSSKIYIIIYLNTFRGEMKHGTKIK